MTPRSVTWRTRCTVRTARVRLGRRGVALTLLGLIWVACGLSVIVAPTAPGYPLLTMYPEARSVVWVITGVTALITAWRSNDAVGFAALYVMAGYRLFAYLLAVIDWLDDHHGGPGNPRGIVGALSWLVICVLIRLLAGWPEYRTDDGEGTA